MTSLNILLADDDPLVRAVMAEEIEEAGHRVRPVRSGAEAITALGDDTFDILLVDYEMPGMMGVETAQRARAVLPHLPIALLTGYGDTLEATGRSDVFPVIQKGRMQSVLNAILALAGGDVPLPASSPENRWEEIQRRMAATANSQHFGDSLRTLYEPADAPLPDEMEKIFSPDARAASDGTPENDEHK